MRAELSHVLVRQLSKAAGTDLRLAEPFLASIVGPVVQSGAFRSVFDAALSAAHRTLVDRDTRRIILDLSGTYGEIRGALHVVAPSLAAELPSRHELRVVLLERSQLSTVWDVVDQVRRDVALVALGSAVLVVVGLALAVRRWRALRLGAWILAGGSALVVVALVVGREIVSDRISEGTLADAVHAAFGVITGPLIVQSLVIAAAAVVVAFAASWSATHGVRAWVDEGRAWWRWLQSASPAGSKTATARPPGRAPGLPRVRLAGPGSASSATHAVRGAGLVVAGLFAVLDPHGVAAIVVVLGGIVFLYLALLEILAAGQNWSRRRTARAATPPANHQIR